MDIAKETQSLFEKFQGSNRSSWMTESNEDYDFRFGNQWTETQVADMNEKGQANIRYDICLTCGYCAPVCPVRAIIML